MGERLVPVVPAVPVVPGVSDVPVVPILTSFTLPHLPYPLLQGRRLQAGTGWDFDGDYFKVIENVDLVPCFHDDCESLGTQVLQATWSRTICFCRATEQTS